MTQLLFKLLKKLNPECGVCNKTAIRGFKVKSNKDKKSKWVNICSKKCLSKYIKNLEKENEDID